MRAALKYLGYAFTAVVVLVVVVAIALPLLIDPNDYQDDIETIVRQQTGREITIEGDMQLRVFPWLGLALGPVRMANVPGFDERPFAQVHSAQVSLRVLPLLFARRIDLGVLSLDGLQLNLAVNAAGQSNWEDLTGGGEDQAPAPTPEPDGSEGGEPMFSLGDISVASVSVTDAEVNYRDLASGAEYAISGLRLETGSIRFGQPFAVELEFDLALSEPQLRAHTLARGDLRVDARAQRYALTDFRLSTGLQSELIGKDEVDVEGVLSAFADLKAGTASISGLKLDAAGLTVQGSAEVSGLEATPSYTGRIELAPFSPRKIADRLAVTLPPMGNEQALRRLAASADFRGDTEHVALQDLLVALDDTRANGALEARFGGRVPMLIADLTVDRLNVDRYLPPAEEGADAPSAGPAGDEGATEAELPFDLLRQANADLRIRVGDLQAAGLRSEAVLAEARLHDGRLRVHPAQAKLYGGQYRGDIRINAPAEGKPSIAMDETLSGIRLGDLLTDMMDTAYVSGNADLSAKLAGTGATLSAIQRSLNGDVSVALEDGRVYGLDLLERIAGAYAHLKGEAPQDEAAGEETPFAELSATGRVSSGVIRNEDLRVSTPVMMVSGEGKVDLVEQKVDYRLTVVLTESGGPEWLDDIRGKPVPVKVSGGFSSLNVRPDVAGALEARLKKEVDEEKREFEKRLEKRGREKLEEGLRKLFD